MARIVPEYFEVSEKNRNNVHEVVDATYSTFDLEGEHYFQIDTYGSKGRKIKGKCSQSIQIDKKTAQLLVEILMKEFWN